MIDIYFSHPGLGATTLIHAWLTFLTGFLMWAQRRGYPPRGRWRSVIRVAHTALGVLLVIYVTMTYLIVPY